MESRILNGQFGDRTGLAMRLCEQYGVEPYAHNGAAEFDDLALRLRDLWDGMPAGARRLRALLSAAIEIKRGNDDGTGGDPDPAAGPIRATARPMA